MYDCRAHSLEVKELQVKIRNWIEKFFGGQKVKEVRNRGVWDQSEGMDSRGIVIENWRELANL